MPASSGGGFPWLASASSSDGNIHKSETEVPVAPEEGTIAGTSSEVRSECLSGVNGVSVGDSSAVVAATTVESPDRSQVDQSNRHPALSEERQPRKQISLPLMMDIATTAATNDAATATTNAATNAATATAATNEHLSVAPQPPPRNIVTEQPVVPASASTSAATIEMELGEQTNTKNPTTQLAKSISQRPTSVTSPLSPGASTSASAALPQRSPGKRPSPWREPRLDHALPPPAKDFVVDHSTAKKAAPSNPLRLARKRNLLYRKLFADVISVHIPLSVTVDLGTVVQRQRTKRVKALYLEFPKLRPAHGGGDGKRDDDANLEGDTKKDAPRSKTLPKLKHVPQPQDFASVIDYLEAKYVQGVVIYDDDDVAASAAPSSDGGKHYDDEGDGSVYSETSFLDDSGLQRTVAEQVLGHQTTTKLEMMGTDGDDGFFVNVGDLEVEETELTQEAYDPINDTNRRGQKGSGNIKKSRKRKAPPTSSSATASATGAATSPKEPKKKMVKTEAGTSAVSTAATKKEPPTKLSEKKTAVAKADASSNDPAVIPIRNEAEALKKEVDVVYGDLVAFVKGFTEEELPRKPKQKRTRVTVTIPLDQKLKETVVFANPHVPGQRITAKVPPNLKPGDSFKVMVRKPLEKSEEDEDDDPGKDHNKLSREFYDKLEDYSRIYDEWCDAEGAYRKIMGGDKSFQPHLAKRLKFDKLVTEFPKDMKTVADKDYIKKILRRARQNKHKREQTLARQMKLGGSVGGSWRTTGGVDDDSDTERGLQTGAAEDDESGRSSAEDEKVKVPSVASKRPRCTRTIVLPDLASSFPTKVLCLDDFKEKSTPKALSNPDLPVVVSQS